MISIQENTKTIITPTLINKNITANGTYNASSDEADGYKKVVVDVPPTTYPDWSAIGYEETPQSIIDGYNYAKQIYDNWDASKTSLYRYFYKDEALIFMPDVEVSNVSNFNNCFENCISLIETPQLNTSQATSFNSTFSTCYMLKTIGLLDCSNVTSITNFNTYNTSLTSLGGFKDLGKAYLTTAQENYNNYTLDLSTNTGLTHDSLMNVINNLYDIKTKGCNNQRLILGSTNLAKLTAEEIAIATNKGWNVS